MSIKVSIKDKNTLVLLENGNIGDEIDLREIQNVDLSSIEKKLKESKDEIYQKMLEDEGRRFELKLANEIEKAKKPLEKEIDKLNKDLEVRNATLEASLKLKEQEVEISGGVRLDTLRELAEIGPRHADFISVGRLTHSAAASDFSMTLVNNDTAQAKA